MDSHQTQQYLESFINHEIHLDQARSSAFKLERVQRLLKNLGDPQDHLKVIHVAGTKGKGSICALTANILKESNYRVGLYTSPHINDMRERIRILAKAPMNSNSGDIFPDMISNRELADVLGEIKPLIEQSKIEEEIGRLSFFEVFTALALYYFRQQKVDFVVLETGLGGRLDATNAAPSLIAVIAPISLEHTHILGNTISDITKEKAAIIKERKQNVIISPQDDQAKEILKNRCSQFDIDPVWTSEQAKSTLISQSVNGQVIDLSTEQMEYKRLELPLLGAHQRDNCAAAVSIVECLKESGYVISPDAIRNGTKGVFWPLRFEIINNEPLVVLDGAHTTASVRALAGLMKEIFNHKRTTLVFGVSKDKDKEPILSELKKITENIIFTKADHPRAADLPGALSVQKALDLARQKSEPNDIILVTGSIFVVSEARAIIEEMKRVASAPLPRFPVDFLGDAGAPVTGDHHFLG